MSSVRLDLDSVRKYYSETQFEYRLLWNWGLKGAPALHFGYYDEKARTHKDALLRANGALAEWAEIPRGAKILDAGCGLGQSSFWLAENLDAKVTGISLVEKQINTINAEKSKNSKLDLKFLVSDYLSTPFEDESFDIVWAFESVCHAETKFDFYKEAHRILKKGGKLVISEYARPFRPMDQAKEELLKFIFNSWAIADLDTIEEHKENSLKAGFYEFRSRNVDSNVAQSYKNLRDSCRRYSWLSSLLLKTGIISQVRHNNMLGSMRQYEAITSGVFSYNHISCIK